MLISQSLEKPAQVQAADYRMYIVIGYLTYLGIAVHSILMPFFFWLGYDVLAAFNIFAIIAWYTARVTNRNGHHTIAIVLLISETALHTILAVHYLGWQSGFQYYLMAGIPFSMFIHKIKLPYLLLLCTGLCVLFIVLYSITHGRVYHYQFPIIIEVMNYSNIVITFLALSVNSYYFRVASFVSEKQMEALANADQLTGLTNRRGILRKLNAQHDLFTRNGTCFTLVLSDIDHFKKFNDTYGHDCGDYVLQGVAQLMQDRLRQYDVVSRWGGEEFLVMLPDTEVDAAIGVAEEIRRAIESEKFNFNGQSLSVTMTFGVAQHQTDDSIDNTIKRADDVLYHGKENGRNRVVS